MAYHSSNSSSSSGYSPEYVCNSLPDRSTRRDRLSENDLVNIAAHVRARFNAVSLSSTPAGFPFHYATNGRGGGRLSYESYEFQEDIGVMGRDGSWRRERIHIAFTGTIHRETACQRNVLPKYFSWLASVVHPSSRYYKNECQKTPLAHVQLDPAVMNTTYGRIIRKNPAVIFCALALSIEREVLITITIADLSNMSIQNRCRSFARAGDIIFIATNHAGQKKMIQIVKDQ